MLSPLIAISKNRRFGDGSHTGRSMEYPIKTVCVVGLGYIGLPTAAALASCGVEVIGADINLRVVEAVNAGQPYFSEPDLDMLPRAATTLGKLRAMPAPEPADAFIIAVLTPFRENRTPNLDYIDQAADAIAPVLSRAMP
jgi:UDP-N-acetyl-D-mannosaminuronic acid dehydrogenase